nr:hypothetical protein [Kibdelosporangium sp. MJ126-NF4]
MISVLGLAVGLAVLQPIDAPPAPRLDVPAAIAALETHQVYQAPGTETNVDVAAVTRELAPDMKLLIAPFAGPTPSLEYEKQVTKPLDDWARSRSVRLITVDGLHLDNVGGPENLAELRQVTAYMDVTGPALESVRYMKDTARHDSRLYPTHPTSAPTSDQVANLVAKLRQNPVYNAPDRSDRATTPVAAIRQKYGFSLRVVALPALKPGEPFVEYAPALAKEFPDDIVLVAQGHWIDIAGKDQQRLESARNYTMNHDRRVTLFRGTTVDRVVRKLTGRLGDLGRHKPLGDPQPQAFDLGRTLVGSTPLLWGGSAAILGGGVLVSGLVLLRRRRRAVTALRTARARAQAAISELGAVLEESPRADATERHVTASELFEQATTAAAMAEAERVADEGLARFGLSVLSSDALDQPEPTVATVGRQPGLARRILWRQKYLGVPRWVVGGVLVGVIACVAVPFDQGETPSNATRAVVEELRRDPVYVQPGVTQTVDPDVVRRTIGDRPIVVAFLSPEMPPEDRVDCDSLAELTPDNLVVLSQSLEARFWYVCADSDFAFKAVPDGPSQLANDVNASLPYSEMSTLSGGSKIDYAVWLGELVQAFDAETAKHYPGPVPRRAAVPTELTNREIAFAAGGLVAVCLAVAFLVHLAVGRLGRRV